MQETVILYRPTGPKEMELLRQSGMRHTEWWIPAEELEELNDNIVGLIEVIGEYRAWGKGVAPACSKEERP